MSEEKPSPTIGMTVYTDDGQALGTIRGFDDDGFFVTTEDGIEAMSVEHERSGHEFGEAQLMWRCTNCGEMDHLDDDGDDDPLPEKCPNCGTEKENLMYWTED